MNRIPYLNLRLGTVHTEKVLSQHEVTGVGDRGGCGVVVVMSSLPMLAKAVRVLDAQPQTLS
jgi:hypothetical protein